MFVNNHKIVNQRKVKTKSESAALAQAGLDLFLSGYVHDATDRSIKESRFPSLTPNLHMIPENAPSCSTEDGHEESQYSRLIVIIGGPINSDHSPGSWLTYRIHTACTLYRQLMSTSSSTTTTTLNGKKNVHRNNGHQPNLSKCYIVPTGGDVNGYGITEAEVIRNVVTEAGLPPHQIIMDCIHDNSIDNAMKLIPALRHLNIHKLHIVTSEFHIPRVKMCFDGILGAMTDMEFNIQYHVAPDGLTSTERTQRDTIEQTFIVRCRPQLDLAIDKVKHGKFGAEHVGLGFKSDV